MAYMLFATAYFEEPDLVREIGTEYEEYMKKTPRYIPNFLKFIKTAKD
jgi:protein-S-isoprenylcysteine O-methyltransferase Ste14